MSRYAITFARSARKELEALPELIIRKIAPKIDALADTPRPHGAKKLQDERNLWRIRVGDYRVVYSIDAKARVFDITRIAHRSHAYE